MRISLLFLKLIHLMLLIVRIDGKVVRFDVESSDQSKSSSENDDDESGYSSSSSSSAELLINERHSDGRFNHLKKDDDLLSLKNKHKKNKNNQRRKRKSKEVDQVFPVQRSIGGQQPIGFIYSRGWFKDSGTSQNGFTKKMEKLTGGIVKEPINLGWWLFTFSKTERSPTKFKFQTSLPVRVTVVDLFCRGDSFGILDEGKLIAQSSRIRADPDPECEERMVNPSEALIDGRWSSVIFELEAGEHFIELKTIDAPIKDDKDNENDGKGIAAIKFESILPAEARNRRISRNKVCRGYNGLAVITEPIPAAQSEIACLQLKMQINRSNESELLVKKSLKSCGKAVAWVVDRESGTVKAVGSDGKYQNESKYEKLPVICRVF